MTKELTETETASKDIAHSDDKENEKTSAETKSTERISSDSELDEDKHDINVRVGDDEEEESMVEANDTNDITADTDQSAAVIKVEPTADTDMDTQSNEPTITNTITTVSAEMSKDHKET